MFTSRVTLLAVTAIVVGAGTVGRAAGKSDVADAVMKGDKAALRRLLQQNADVNGHQIDGATALVESICVVELCQERVPKRER
jgi:hypothetical protein